MLDFKGFSTELISPWQSEAIFLLKTLALFAPLHIEMHAGIPSQNPSQPHYLSPQTESAGTVKAVRIYLVFAKCIPF